VNFHLPFFLKGFRIAVRRKRAPLHPEIFPPLTPEVFTLAPEVTRGTAHSYLVPFLPSPGSSFFDTNIPHFFHHRFCGLFFPYFFVKRKEPDYSPGPFSPLWVLVLRVKSSFSCPSSMPYPLPFNQSRAPKPDIYLSPIFFFPSIP